MDSNDISNSLNNGEIFESLGVEDKSSIVTGVTGSLLTLDVETGVDDLEGADVAVLVGLVGEGSIDNNTVNVLGIS